MREAVIVSMVRTPVGRVGGALSSITAADLGALAIREAVRRAGIDPALIDDVIFGNILNNDWQNIARAAALAAGLPMEVPAIKVDRECGSGANAVAFAAMSIQSGFYDVVVAGGVESDSTRPWIMAKPKKAFQVPCPEMFYDPPSVTDAIGECPMVDTAQNVGEKFHMTRQECDGFALRSHELADAAWNRGFYDESVMEVSVPQRKGAPIRIKRDETIRPETTMESLGRLTPVAYRGDLVTAGNSSPLCDGAAALVLMDKALADRLGLKPLGKITGYAVAGVHPHFMGMGPMAATPKLLKKAGKTLRDIDIIEINEAFAAQAVPCCRELGFDMAKVNVNGGAIALGHPMGGTGAILTIKVLDELRDRGEKTGLVTMCIGGGQGIAMLVENCRF
ncbi:thiolase family protein [Pusillibacter faecalis]|uniref:Acetyl-CoA acetyltransferase n=1 Tax=Pusillibacter faecalis TaxID=2714358 RepID=A0A810QHA5_9FIRM|nr:thiolase family protein [Pusillibacter faecalis]MBS5657735.1 thiolase family protein [Oscillibacter sp.]MCQ5027500.1 thiolase family protein [Oscillibacter valericigenes]BCK84901.1 acetyl-CoA acetyltransferase [Pusillibacter faecalis]